MQFAGITFQPVGNLCKIHFGQVCSAKVTSRISVLVSGSDQPKYGEESTQNRLIEIEWSVVDPITTRPNPPHQRHLV
jgi:hypothetical protein